MYDDKKVGIVTLYHGNYNFGGLLQAYALPAALHKYLGIHGEQIDYVLSPGDDKRQWTKEHLSLPQKMYELGWRFFNRLEKKHFACRKKVFDQFIDDIPHSKETYCFDSVSNTLREYYTFICGGDQIWNNYQIIGWYGREDLQVFTLQFVPEHIKKIAYAPSMAVLETTDEFEQIMKEGLSGFAAISVREKRSVPVLERLTDKPVSVVVDPVLLLTKAHWQEVARTKSMKQKYILCYLLGDSVEQRKAVKKLAKRLHLAIVTFPHIIHNSVRKCDLFFGDIRNYDGPREFLGLIQNAEMVITDSFHACVFSMIFQTPFAVFERNKPNAVGNMNSRIYDFLEEYHLESQLMTEEALAKMRGIPDVNFTYAQAHWKKRRAESLTYLENALKDNHNGAEY